MSLKSQPTISVLVAAHNEGILAQKTLMSLRDALKECDKNGITYEVLCTLDNPTEDTLAFFKTQKIIKATLVEVYKGDLAENRMAGITAAHGRYVAVIDADDLCSKNWLVEGYEIAKANKRSIVHTEYSINFGTMDILWKKTNSKSPELEAIYNVQANRWDSALITERSLLLEYGYRPNRDGFGSEDWDLNMRTLGDKISHLVAAETILFVRRKESGSELDKQRQQKRIVRPSELLALSRFRAIDEAVFSGMAQRRQQPSYISAAHTVKRNYQYIAHRSKTVKRAGSLAKRIVGYEKRQVVRMREEYPDWLLAEWKRIHSIEKQLFPTKEAIKKMIRYDAEQIEIGYVYKQIADYTRYDKYDYVLFVPYLNKGGADLVAVRYVNTIHRLSPGIKICVIATTGTTSQWASRLDEGIDFVPFGEVAVGISVEIQKDIIARFVTNCDVKAIHIINSKLAYEFVATYSQYIVANKVKVFASAFCEDIAPNGHIQGYIHTELPKVYAITEQIFTDNKAIIDSLCKEYGYDKKKFICHYVPVDENTNQKSQFDKTKKLLWAGRISHQKQPKLLRDIAIALSESMPDIHIDVFGSFDTNIDKRILDGLGNVTYKGGFDNGLYTLDLDVYDALLYTSLYDGIPNMLLEAVNARLPIITSSVGGIGELCVDQETALVVADQHDIHAYIKKIKELYEIDDATLQTMLDLGNSNLLDQHSQQQFDRHVEEDIISKI